jgi:hypothetical protein
MQNWWQNQPNTLKSVLGFGIGLLFVLVLIYCLRKGWHKFRRPRTKGLWFHLWRSGAVSKKWRQAAFKSFIRRALTKNSLQVHCARARQDVCAVLSSVEEPARQQLIEWAATLSYEEGLCNVVARQLQRSNVVAKLQLVQVAEHDKKYLEVVLCAAAVAGPAAVALAAAHVAAASIRVGCCKAGATAEAATSMTAKAVAAAALLAASAVQMLTPDLGIQFNKLQQEASQAAQATAVKAAAAAAASATEAGNPGGAQQPAASAALAAAEAAVNAVTAAISAARAAAAGAAAAPASATQLPDQLLQEQLQEQQQLCLLAAAPEASVVAASATAAAKAASLASGRAARGGPAAV